MATNDSKTDRDARLAAALRANLRRRKAHPPVAGAASSTAPPAEPDGEPVQPPVA